MNRLTRDDVRKVAGLARLKLRDDELDRFTSQLGQVLEYVGLLSELDTTAIEPMAHAVPVANVWREDIVSPSLPREAALANAPRTDGRCFLVPPILE
jgi:aspartyl-tRNA(Asn)/glutamyl-tRNA(Gln) amidotransferase subunit C